MCRSYIGPGTAGVRDEAPADPTIFFFFFFFSNLCIFTNDSATECGLRYVERPDCVSFRTAPKEGLRIRRLVSHVLSPSSSISPSVRVPSAITVRLGVTAVIHDGLLRIGKVSTLYVPFRIPSLFSAVIVYRLCIPTSIASSSTS